MDAGKTVVVGTSGVSASSANPNALLWVMTEQASLYTIADFIGTWQGNALASGRGAPWWERDTLTINPDGSSTVSWTAYDGSTGSATGNFVISLAGAVTWTCADCSSNQSFSGFMDAGKTVMVFTDTWASDTGTQEIKIFTKDAATVPNAPTNAMAGAGNARAAVSFTAPVSNCSYPVTSYTVTSNPSGIRATGSGSPIIVSGLTNGTAYRFTVTANNAIGPSVPSTPSNSVTPSLVPPSYMADLEGIWNFNDFSTGPDAPWWERMTMTVASDGTFTFSGTESNGSTDTGSGALWFSQGGILLTNGTPNNILFQIDSGNTVLVGTSTTSDGSSELCVGTKQGASYQYFASIWEGNILLSGQGSTSGWATSSMTFDSNGNFTGTLSADGGTPTSISGQTSLSSTGVQTCLSGSCLDPTYEAFMDASESLLVGISGASPASPHPNNALLWVFTQQAASYSMADLAGTWQGNLLASASPYWQRMTFAINPDGTFTSSYIGSDGSTGSGTGALSISSTGVITCVSGDCSGANQSTVMDAGKTVMVETTGQPGSGANIIVFTKSGAGALTVTIGPAAAVTAGAMWNVDGGAWQASGATVSNLSVGPHTVGFSKIVGWTSPSVQTANITNGQTTSLSATCVLQTGSLTVTISPAAAVSAGAMWNVDGGSWQTSGATVSNLIVGMHTVGFKDVNGWTTPSAMTTNISNGRTTSLSGTYVQQSGSLKVTISPAAAVSAGAMWNVDGGSWHASGATVSSLRVGSHTVAFNNITGWNSPANQTANISNRQTTSVSGTYVQQTGSLTVTISPAAAVSAGAMWNVDGGSWQASGASVFNLSVGSHTVAFKSITGWTTPSSQTATITNGQTTSLTGTYQTGPLSVTYPVGGETLAAGGKCTITWSYASNPGSNVRIELLNGGSVVSTITSNTPIGKGGAGYYFWTVPFSQAPGKDYKVRVTSISNSSYTATSPNSFTITGPSIAITSPSGGSFNAGAKCTIAWTYAGNPGSSLSIALLQAGLKVSTIASSAPAGSSGNGSYAWTIPAAQGPGTNYQVQVSSTTSSSCTATSSNFTIVAPSISVTSPNGGESWATGEKHNITWSYVGSAGSNVKIELVKGSATAATIMPSASIGNNGTGSYTWTLPATLVTGSDYKVRVTSTTNSSLIAMSQGAFTIKGGISITVTSPGGGETWAAGSTQNIAWSYQGSPGSTVNIQLLNQGVVVSSIKKAASIGSGGSGSYAWTIPKLISGSSYQVQITSTANAFCTSISNYFTIQ
jgi:membrane protein implicated in regulation of membrane protease activity